MISQREREVEVKRGRQIDVSAHVGRELQRLYKDPLTTYRRYALWQAREKKSGSGERERGRCLCLCWHGTAKAVYMDLITTYRR